MRRSVGVCVALGLTEIMFPAAARAEASACAREIRRDNLVICALSQSLSAKAEREGVRAAEARRVAAKPVLPENPVLAVSVARRVGAGSGSTINWYAELSQQIEVGGQRGARRRTAEAEAEAQTERLRATKREAALEAYGRYFDALAARDELGVAKLLEENSARVVDAAKGAAAAGAASDVDADVADALRIHCSEQRISAELAVARTRAALLSLLGLDPAGDTRVEGALLPIAGVRTAVHTRGVAPAARPEVRALEAESRAHHARADYFRRARIPNPTLSVFAQRDGFDEKVFGVGVALPIPLPQPVGRTYAGESAESDALGRRSATKARRRRRELRLELTQALRGYDASLRATALYTPERVARAERGLAAISEQLAAGRLGIRDVVVEQQALVDLLRASIEAKKKLCLASLELARAAGLALERGEP
jgi:outer membrane protein, heavy metal efflux system